MPPPNSPVPHSIPVAGLGAAVLAYRPGVSEAEFLRHFPLKYSVQAFNMYEAQRNGWETDRTFWKFLEPFRYVSDTWGAIDIPANFVTDFASVPPRLQSIITNDAPIILYPSAPHDFLFTKRDSDGTRGWINNTTQLSLTQVNKVLTEAMAICGANQFTCDLVFSAVELANEPIRGEFAPG
jgi:hypothetical protein